MSLILWYKLDGDANDDSGYENHGTITASPSFVPAKINEGCEFSGSTNQRITSPLSYTTFNNSTDFTFSCWVKVLSYPSNETIGLVFGAANYRGYGIAWDRTDAGTFRIVGFYRTDTSNVSIHFTGCELNKWYHFLVVKDFNQIIFYINGVEFNRATHALTGVMELDPGNIGINRTGRYSGSNADAYLNCTVDDARIYNRALSVKEIKEVYNTKIAHWKFDDFQEPTINVLDESDRHVDDPLIGDEGYSFYSPTEILFTTLGIEEGDYVTISADMKVDQDLLDDGRHLRLYVWVTTDTGGWGYASSVQVHDTYWTRASAIREVHTTTGYRGIRVGAYRYPSGATDGPKAYLKNIQLEVKSYDTPFVNGERTGIINDSSEYNHHASIVLSNSPKWDEGKIGNGSYYFNNLVLDGEFEYLKYDDLYIPNQFTIMCWIKGDINNQINHNIYPFGWLNLCMMGPTTVAADRTGVIYYYDASNYTSWTYNNSGIWNDVWNHWALSYNEETEDLKLYLNGTITSSTTRDNFFHLNTYRDFHIGSAWSPTYGGFTGNIDDARVYANELSASEINDIYKQRASLDSFGNFHIPQLVEHETEEKGVEIITTSSGLDDLHVSNIFINSTNYSFNDRGHNIVVLNPKGEIISRAIFDTHGLERYKIDVDTYINENIEQPMLDYLSSFNRYDYLIFAVRDSAGNIYQSALDKLAEFGFKDHEVGFRDGWAAICQIGSFAVEDRVYRYDGTMGRIKHFVIDKFNIGVDGLVKSPKFSEVGPTNNLVLWYPFDGDANDLTENNHNATTVQNVELVYGVKGQSYEFDGTDGNDNSRILNDSLKYKLWDEFSLSVWIYPYSISSFCIIMGQLLGNNIDAGFAIRSTARLTLHDYSTTGSDTTVATSANNTIQLNQWQHLGVTYNNGQIYLYYNGIEVDDVYYELGGSNNDLIIGSASNNTHDRAFEGRIDEIRIYDRALSSQEIHTLYHLYHDENRMKNSKGGVNYIKGIYYES